MQHNLCYQVIRGAVSIYALNSSSYNSESNQNGRSKYGVFIKQLPPGESFGELSFNGDGDRSKRNAGVVSDGCHSSESPSVLLLIPEEVYMREMFARHAAKHQTKDKIALLRSSLLFKHWTMDQLVRMSSQPGRATLDSTLATTFELVLCL